MKIAVTVNTRGVLGTQAQALVAGLRRHGVRVDLVSRLSTVAADAVVVWGWRNGELMRRRGHQVLVMERGYIGDRFAWTSLGWNGLNGRAGFCLPPAVDRARFDRFHARLMRPWRRAGETVAIMAQVPGDAALDGRDLTPWYIDAARQAGDRYGLPVVIRPHPVAVERRLWRNPGGLKEATGDLAAVLAHAAIVVCWNSNAAVDAVLAGVPAVVADQGSMAWPVAGHEIGERLYPARDDWAARLAWCQWSLDEMASGDAWDRMRQHLNAGAVAA